MSSDETSRHRRPLAVGQQLTVAAARRRSASTASSHGVVGDGDQTLLAGLGRVLEDDLLRRRRAHALPDRGQPEAAVGLGVLLAADAEEAEVEQPERRRQHPLAWQARRGRGARRRRLGRAGGGSANRARGRAWPCRAARQTGW